MTNLQGLYDDYGSYNILLNQLNLPSPSIEYAWRRTKLVLHDEVLRCVFELLKFKKQVAICDIGCGNGGFLIRLALELKNHNLSYVGLDLSSSFVDYAKKAAREKKLDNLVFKQLDFEKDNLVSKFDIIVSSEVLEHVEDPGKFLSKVNSILAPDGFFLMSTPNSNNYIKYPLFFLKSIVSRINEKEIKRFLLKKEEKFRLSEHEQHLFLFSHNELKRLFFDRGFSIYKTPRSTTFFGGAFLDSNPILFSASLILDSILNFIPLPQIGWDNIIFARKK